MSSDSRAEGGPVDDKKPVLCPSSRCKEGHLLLGVVRADGTVGFLGERMVVDQEFVSIAQQGRRPEKRFRFASPCAQSACRHWTGERCGVIDEAFECVPESYRGTDLPACSIREQCRWHQQEGDAACSVCPLVITDLMVDDKPEELITAMVNGAKVDGPKPLPSGSKRT